MEQLLQGEKEVMDIFRHFKVTEGQGLMFQNIRAVQTKYISPPNWKKIDTFLNNLSDKQYINYEKKQIAIGFF